MKQIKKVLVLLVGLAVSLGFAAFGALTVIASFVAETENVFQQVYMQSTLICGLLCIGIGAVGVASCAILDALYDLNYKEIIQSIPQSPFRKAPIMAQAVAAPPERQLGPHDDSAEDRIQQIQQRREAAKQAKAGPVGSIKYVDED